MSEANENPVDPKAQTILDSSVCPLCDRAKSPGKWFCPDCLVRAVPVVALAGIARVPTHPNNVARAMALIEENHE